MMLQVGENAMIAKLASLLPHRPEQVNGLQESDAELVRIPGGGHQILAVTTDGIVEEIDSGLYADPYLIGWMTVMANLSDLAAVGADPLGLLVAETLPQDFPDADLVALQSGIRDACLHSSTPVLGGDTNFSDRLQMTGTAIGLVQDGHPLMRVRCSAGEILFSTGPFGMGNAYAALRLMQEGGGITPTFRPIPRLLEGASLRTCASVCMDTSDGLLAALDQLGRLNGCGFRLTSGPDRLVAPHALHVAVATGLSPWMFLAGPHGEFELVFTVPESKIDTLSAAASHAGWTPLRIGVTTDEPGISIDGWGQLSPGDVASIRDHPLRTADERAAFTRFLAGIERSRAKSTRIMTIH